MSGNEKSARNLSRVCSEELNAHRNAVPDRGEGPVHVKSGQWFELVLFFAPREGRVRGKRE